MDSRYAKIDLAAAQPFERRRKPRRDTVTVRKLANYVCSSTARYVDVTLPRLRCLEGAA